MHTEFGCVGTKFTGFGLRGSRTSVTMTPRLTRVPTYAWPRATITWTPSPRPPWSVWPTNSMFRAPSGTIMACFPP